MFFCRTHAEALKEQQENPDEDKVEPWLPAPKPGATNLKSITDA